MTAAVKPINGAPGNVLYVDEREQPVTVLGTFWPGKNTIPEVLAAACAVERLGYVPEIRFSGNGKDPESLELVTRDVPAMIGKLRASLTSTPTKEASNRGTPKAASLEGQGGAELSDLEAAMRCHVCKIEATDDNKGRRPHEDVWLCNAHGHRANEPGFLDRALASLSTNGAQL